MDERAAGTFTRPGDEVGRVVAVAGRIWSPRVLVGIDPRPVGTLIGADRMRALAGAAGYCAVEVVPVDHPFWRFDRLVP